MGARGELVLPVIRVLSHLHEDFKERIVCGLDDRVQHFYTLCTCVVGAPPFPDEVLQIALFTFLEYVAAP